MFQFLTGFIFGHMSGSLSKDSNHNGSSVFMIILFMFLIIFILQSIEESVLNLYFDLLNYKNGTTLSYKSVFMDNQLLKFKEVEEAIALSISISFYKIFTVMLLVFSTIILFLKITLGSISIIRDIENKTKMFFMLLFNIFICFLLFYLVVFLVDYIYKSLNLY